MGKYFGTDGIRGVAGSALTPTLAYRTGLAAAQVLSKEHGRVIVGKDTRRSGDMLEAAIVAGLTAGGMDVELLGVVPTPAVAYETANSDAVLGIMISASHNPSEYNGIKIFGFDGYKLPDAVEAEIEEVIDDERFQPSKIGADIGRVIHNEDGALAYINHMKESITCDFHGITVALDCGHGSNSAIAPRVFQELGATVHAINTEPDGLNINNNCGSTNPSMIQQLVLNTKSDAGFSFDGDADRVIAVDEKGVVMDGDHILAALGLHMKNEGILKNDGIVGTVMTNIGLDLFAKEKGITLHKSSVGDRYVLEDMKKLGYVLGGEQSGHIIFLDKNTTGDGLLTALKLMELYVSTEKKASEYNEMMESYPQVLVNARVSPEGKKNYANDPIIQEEIQKLTSLYHGEGRVLIRPSGTEPLVRVMIEGKDRQQIEAHARMLAKIIEERFPL